MYRELHKNDVNLKTYQRVFYSRLAPTKIRNGLESFGLSQILFHTTSNFTQSKLFQTVDTFSADINKTFGAI